MKSVRNYSIQDELLKILKMENFFLEIKENIISIEEKNAASHLKKVVIKDIPCDEDNFIWRFNLETKIIGLSPVQHTKTVETAFAFIKENVLKIYLIELKSSIREEIGKSTLSGIMGKIEDSISRLYYLIFLTLKSHIIDLNSFKKSEFQAIVFYNKSKIDADVDKSSRIYQVFEGKEKLIECEPIVGKQKISLKFCKNPTRKQEFFEVSFNILK